MARPLRIAFEGAFYHGTARGNERRKILLPQRDYEKSARKHTPFSNREIGGYFGGISYFAATKIDTRIKDRMRRERKMREEMIQPQARETRSS